MTRRWLGAALVSFSAAAVAQDHVLDDFSEPALWKLSATDDVHASLRSAEGPHGKALCIDYDFGRVTGYVTAQRASPLELPPRYAFTMNLRGEPAGPGEAPRNAFQFKLVDASGENVWWGQRSEFRFPAEWQPLQFRQRQIEFAWGPTADRTLRRSASVEFVIASGSGAEAGPNRGSACFDGLTLRRLPDVPPPVPAPVMRADALGVDFGIAREFGALALRWRAGAIASSYAIELSDDGVQWRRVRTVEHARGGVQTHWLPDAESRFVRVVPMGGAAAALDSITPLDAASANAFFAQLAKQSPRGAYPRAYVGEQSYWTVLGVDAGRVASLLGEDGTLEPLPGVGALEPFPVVDSHVRSWADARITHSLVGGDLPMPAVHWQLADGLALDIEAFGHGTPEAAQALARYTVRNRSSRTHDVTLALAWRPFQANPPTQFLANPGGASEVKAIVWSGRELQVDGKARVVPLTAPDAVRMEPLAAGPVGNWLNEGAGGTQPQQIVDDAGFASGVLRYRLHLRPGERREIAVALPVSGAPASTTRLNFEREQRRTAALWRERLDRVRIEGPAEVEDIARTMRSALGHILVNRSGPALQPGARAYARSWIRDGALTSSALLRLGHEREAREFILWFARFQFKNGKVPCCATVRGADPVPENDSDGEFVFAVADLWNYTHDATTARALWPNVRAAIEHMETLRQSERSDKNTTPDRAAYFGLMPPSISHEGYSDKPAYSYWDDFWAAIGYRGGFELAQALGLPDDAARIAAQRAEFEADLMRSLAAATQQHGMSVLPGAADRGDVDPTSSTVALSPGGLLGRLPDALVQNTFDRWWHDFESRRADDVAGRRHGDGAYTPYEWRNVGALLRLGERERALQAMAYFYRDRRPTGWNQWAEVVVRDPREPRFLGDMPHGWVASDQIRSVLDLFGYEHESEHALVLAAGVPMRWLAGRGVGIAGLRTPYGDLSWRAHASGGDRRVIFEMAPLRDVPPGGVWLRGPWPAGAVMRVDGRRVPAQAQGVRLPSGGGRVVIDW